MATTFRLKRKSFSKYDETDNLKRMKDSDILAEKKKEAPGYGNVVSSGFGGAVAGGVPPVAYGHHQRAVGQPRASGFKLGSCGVDGGFALCIRHA